MGALRVRTCGRGSAPPHPISHLKSSSSSPSLCVFLQWSLSPILPFNYVSYSRGSGSGSELLAPDILAVAMIKKNPTKPQTMLEGEVEKYDHPKGSVAMLESMIIEGNIAIISAFLSRVENLHCFFGLFTKG
nr:chloride channel protein CLC-e [Ipomoea trifida]